MTSYNAPTKAGIYFTTSFVPIRVLNSMRIVGYALLQCLTWFILPHLSRTSFQTFRRFVNFNIARNFLIPWWILIILTHSVHSQWIFKLIKRHQTMMLLDFILVSKKNCMLKNNSFVCVGRIAKIRSLIIMIPCCSKKFETNFNFC